MRHKKRHQTIAHVSSDVLHIHSPKVNAAYRQSQIGTRVTMQALTE